MCATRRPGAGGFFAAEGVPPIRPRRSPSIPARRRRPALAVSASGGSVPAEELAAITERAGGNPLFVRELVTATRSEGGVAAGERRGGRRTRIDRLSTVDRALLRWASVLGGVVLRGAAAEVLAGDLDAAPSTRRPGTGSGSSSSATRTSGAFRFRHALIRDAAYDGLVVPAAERAARAGGEALRAGATDAGEVAELLSLHYMLGRGAARDVAATPSSRASGEAKFANVDAAEFFRRALDAAEELPRSRASRSGRRRESLGDLLLLSGDFAEARNAYRQARTLVRGDAMLPPSSV